MSISLKCYKCESEIGFAEMKDNYKEQFKKLSKDGNPICENCDFGYDEEFSSIKFWVYFLIFLFSFISIGYFLTNF